MTPAEAFQAFGLIGTWSVDCRRVASADNPRIAWTALSSGQVVHTVTLDGQTPWLIDTVTDAVILSNDELRFTVARRNGARLTATITMSQGLIQSTRSVAGDGTVLVDRGIEIATGKATMIYERCGMSISRSSQSVTVASLAPTPR
ncbi:MAG: hypothetical protein ABSC95_08465 [Acetobacteraceae bacterium]|jgi:hypothetical protein